MRSLQLGRWTLIPTARRFTTALSAAILGIMLFSSLLPAVADTASMANGDDGGLGSVALRTIDVGGFGGPDSGSGVHPLNGAGIEQLSQIDHVERVEPWAQVDLSVQTGSGDYASYTLTSRITGLQPPLLEGREPKGPNELLVSSTSISTAGLAVGAEAAIKTNRYVSNGVQEGVDSMATIVGTYDAAVVGTDGPGAIYGSPDYVLGTVGAGIGHDLAWMKQNYEFTAAYVIVDSNVNLSDAVRAAQHEGFGAGSLASLLTQVSSLQAFLNGLRPVLAGLLAIFLIVTAWTLSTSMLASRRGEVGLLRAIGWKRGEILSAFSVQLAVLGALVGALGAILGATLAGVLQLIGPGDLPISFDVGWSSLIVVVASSLVVAVFFVAASVAPLARLSRTAPDEVLRDL